MLDLMERFDPVQIRYAGNEFRRLVDLTAMKARRLSQVSAPDDQDDFTLLIHYSPLQLLNL